MPLSPGTTLGVYEVLSPIGAGGMGEVYKAHDTKVDRDVTLKILPDAFVNDPERLARFEGTSVAADGASAVVLRKGSSTGKRGWAAPGWYKRRAIP